MMLDHGKGIKEKVSVKRPTRHAAETCQWACKLFGQMACDNAMRLAVADDAIPTILQAMVFCPEDGMVQLTACKALYNCVYRCEAAHVMATEEDAMSCVEPLLDTFTADKDLLKLAERCIRSLQPDGWRGSADDPGKVVGGGEVAEEGEGWGEEGEEDYPESGEGQVGYVEG